MCGNIGVVHAYLTHTHAHLIVSVVGVARVDELCLRHNQSGIRSVLLSFLHSFITRAFFIALVCPSFVCLGVHFFTHLFDTLASAFSDVV